MIGEAWVSDLDTASKPGEIFETIAHFPAPTGDKSAERFIAGIELVTPDDVHRGRYAIDVDNGEAG
jgi:hypothetical protein